MNKKDVTYTPMMQQYLEIKKDYADAIVFFRLGDFYEMFFEDAIIASKTLEIALTGRDAGIERVPMCGIPHHAVTPYAQKLIQKGFKIAIAEQVTEPGNGLVKREVIKLITPGMIMDEDILDSTAYNYIGAIIQDNSYFHLAYADLSTGDLSLIEGLDESDLLKHIWRLSLKEVIIEPEQKRLRQKLKDMILISDAKAELDHPLNRDLTDASKKVVGLLLFYLKDTQKNELEQFNALNIIKKESFLQIDYGSRLSLELTDTQNKKGGKTLLSVIDHCVTAIGSRLLKQMMDEPSKDMDTIQLRYDTIDTLVSSMMTLEKLRDAFKGVYDLRRITTRIATKNANGKDLSQLRQTLSRVPNIKAILTEYNQPLLDELNEEIDALETLFQLLNQSITDDPPLTLKEGNLIKEGFNPDLDKLKHAADDGKAWMLAYEQSEKEKTGIKNLKVGYNRVFGYYIDITRGNLDLVKDEYGYIRKQTLANSERFITEALKEKETYILTAGEKQVALEYDLFIEIRNEVARYTKKLQKLSDDIAYLDVMSNLAYIAKQNRYKRPILHEQRHVHIEKGRHPVVEQALRKEYVENDIIIDANGMLLITGPNMSGKSTYMRMFAQLVVLAQMGSFIPAEKAMMPIYDAIYTRIGASDDLSAGQSTFMVEMLEANQAISSATESSLLIFDEIGRGTATYDGMALAQAIIEYVHEKVKSTTLFSTHYHELTPLEQTLKRLKNIHVMATEEKKSIVFLHKIKEGPTDKSYGIHVAELAKLPKSLIKRANEILSHLEKDKKKTALLNLFNFDQIDETYITSKEESILERIKEININELSPLDALLLLKELQDETKR